MFVLAPEEQAVVIGSFPPVFSPAKGAWGRGGSTIVRLSVASEAEVVRALELAWERAIAKRAATSSRKAKR